MSVRDPGHAGAARWLRGALAPAGGGSVRALVAAAAWCRRLPSPSGDFRGPGNFPSRLPYCIMTVIQYGRRGWRDELSAGFRVDPKDAVPIWRQIEQGMRRLVAGGALAPGASVPSMRDLAQELGVNPMTVAKAYQKLADAGIVVSRKGEGTFVAERPQTGGRAERNRALRQEADRMASAAATLDASEEEAVAELRRAFARLLRGSPRGEGGR